MTNLHVGDVISLDRHKAKFNKQIASKVFEMNHPWYISLIYPDDRIKIHPMTTNLDRMNLPGKVHYKVHDWEEAGLNHEALVAISDYVVVSSDWVYATRAHLTNYDNKEIAKMQLAVAHSRLLESTNGNASAWMLRQDGKEFPVSIHLYSDDDWESLADMASFIIRTESKDQDLATKVIVRWIDALLREDEVTAELAVSTYLQNSNTFKYPLTLEKYLEIYNTNNKLIDYNESFESFNTKMKNSINQQFCRVRFGGQYDTRAGNPTIWFRISSVGFDWYNLIYNFISGHKNSLGIKYVTICRDPESDGSTTTMYYRTKDSSTLFYKDMPVNEFLSEEHGSNPVFESVNTNEFQIGMGIRLYTKIMLATGYTLNEIQRALPTDTAVNFEKLYNRFKSLESKRRVL